MAAAGRATLRFKVVFMTNMVGDGLRRVQTAVRRAEHPLPSERAYSKNLRLHPLPVVGPGTLARLYVVLPHQEDLPVYQPRFAHA